jgi:hypothetical protein
MFIDAGYRRPSIGERIDEDLGLQAKKKKLLRLS